MRSARDTHRLRIVSCHLVRAPRQRCLIKMKISQLKSSASSRPVPFRCGAVRVRSVAAPSWRLGVPPLPLRAAEQPRRRMLRGAWRRLPPPATPRRASTAPALVCRAACGAPPAHRHARPPAHTPAPYATLTRRHACVSQPPQPARACRAGRRHARLAAAAAAAVCFAAGGAEQQLHHRRRRRRGWRRALCVFARLHRPLPRGAGGGGDAHRDGHHQRPPHGAGVLRGLV